MPLNLSSIAFSSPANGTAAKVKAVQAIALTAKSSKDLAVKLNKAGIGYTDWKELK